MASQRKRTIEITSDSKRKARASEPPMVHPLSLSSVQCRRQGPGSKSGRMRRVSDDPEENTIVEASVDASNDSDDSDVKIEREISAWDAIGERFENAAHDGRYIDLTGAKERSLPESRAAAEFAAIKTPIDASTIIQSAAAPPTTTEDPRLLPLWKLVFDTVNSLLFIRSELTNEIDRNRLVIASWKKEAWNVKLNKIIQDMRKIQDFVTRHSKLMSNSDKARKRVEQLNLLVMKANILISQLNSQYEAAEMSSSSNTKRRRT